MSLHIIIDGYNLIRQSPELSRLDLQDMQTGRDTLIDWLSAYKRIKGHPITVVFDAANAPTFAQRRDRIKGIQVRFSRMNESADTVIRQMAARERERALVVSSDREIVDFCQARGSATIASGEFEERMALAGCGSACLLEEEDTGWVPTTRKKGPRRRLSKKGRRNRKKIAKL